jgi:hypothetical protein
MFLSELVKLTSEVLEFREEEQEEDLDEDEDLADELDDLKNDIDIKKNTLEIGKFNNEDLAGDEGIVEDGDDFDDFTDGGGILYDSPMDEVCEILYFRDII